MDAISTAAEAASAALILASWVSEVFLAALFLRVVLLPSITQTNARFWSTFSSSASNGNLLVVEKEFDLLVEYWLFQTFRGCARKLTVRRTAAAARFRNIILQTERAIRSTQYSLRSARFPKSSLDPPKGDLDAKIQWLYDFWSVLCFFLISTISLVEAPVYILALILPVRTNAAPKNDGHDNPANAPPETHAPVPPAILPAISPRYAANSRSVLLPPSKRPGIFPRPHHDPRFSRPSIRSPLKAPRPKPVSTRPLLMVETGWRPKTLEPEYWRISPLRQGMGFFSRRAAIRSPRYRRALLLNKLRPSSIGRPLKTPREAHVKGEPQTPMSSRFPARPKSAPDSGLSTLPSGRSPNSPIDVVERTVQATSDLSRSLPTGPPKTTTAEAPETAIQEGQWNDLPARLSSPAPVIPDLEFRDPNRILKALHLHQLQECLVMLHRDYVELGLEEFGMQDIWMLKDSLQVIQEELSLFGNAEDLRGFNGEFFGSLIALVDSCTLHLHFASSIFDIDPVCHGLCERTITAAQSIRTELIAARAVAAMQRAERGLVHDVIGGELMTIGEV